MTTATITKGDLYVKNITTLKNNSCTVLGDSGNPEFIIFPMNKKFLDLAEDYEIALNKDFLEKELNSSLKSGISSFSI